MGHAFRCWAAVLLLAIPCVSAPFIPCRAAAAPSDQDGFSAYVADLLKSQGVNVVVQGPLALSVKGPEQQELDRLYLDRIWNYCSHNRDTCDYVVSDYVKGIAEGIEVRSRPIDRKALRVIVRPSSYVASARTGDGHGDKDPAATPLAGDLWIVCVADFPNSTRSLNNADLRAIKLSLDEAIETGKQNLAAVLPPLPAVTEEVRNGALAVLMNDSYYQSSSIVLHDQWAAIAKAMGGNLTVAVPNSGEVIYGNGASPGMIEALRKAARVAAAGSQRPLTLTLFRWTEDGWEPVPSLFR